MSAEEINKTILRTGLEKHLDKFIDPDKNEPLPGAPEADFYILEAALQRGFEMIDDDGDVYVCSSRQIIDLVKPYRDFAPKPIDMVLHCPACHQQHIDEPETNEEYTGRLFESLWWECGGDKPERWTNPPHRSHQCQHCRFVWRPADVATNGVEHILTQGKNDS